MNIEILSRDNDNYALVHSDKILISEVQDVLDLMANCDYQGARNIIVRKEHITPHFFDLRTGIAGEVLQKFSTYRIKLGIVGDFSKYESKSLRNFIYESNKTGRIIFGVSLEEIIEKM